MAMASNILSRLLPPATSPSIYETMKQYDEESDTDIENRAGMSSRARYHDDDDMGSALDEALDASMGQGDSQTSVAVAAAAAGPGGKRAASAQKRRLHAPEGDDSDDDVPLELLVETDGHGNPILSPDLPAKHARPLARPLPSLDHPSSAEQAKWNVAQQQQRLYKDLTTEPAHGGRPARKGRFIIDPKEKALWRWTNVQNLDTFLGEVYTYFCEKGMYSMILSRILNLITFAFVIGFMTFLSSCIDWSSLQNSKKMSDIYVNQCARKMPAYKYFLLWFCALFWFSQLAKLIADIPRMQQLHDFYHHLLDIPDIDIQTISWQDVVKRLMALRDANPTTNTKLSDRHRKFLDTQSKQRMDAHDIANRLMRRENYMIALINKDTLNLTLPLPYLKSRPILSRTLEWNLGLCILDYIFDQETQQVRSIFLKDLHRKELSNGLRRRLFSIGVLNMFVGPFMVLYVLALYFFRNFSEYQKDPSTIGSRQYTPYAKWKFREFNELSHLFARRVNMSYPFASRYIDQFPKDKMAQLAQFVAFVSGALAAVLALVSLIDPDLFLGFEITQDKTVLFYLGIFSAVWAFARGMIPEENQVFDPEFTMTEVIHFTHYEPNSWKNRLHSDEVRKDFIQLYQVKPLIFLQELLSIITTPFILCFSLPGCSERIIDFVREFTIHVDGLGHICSYAMFDFERDQKRTKQAQQKTNDKAEDLREDFYAAKDNKMMTSYYNFMNNYATNPHQRPSPTPGQGQFHPPPAFPGIMSSHFDSRSQIAGARNEDYDRGPVRSRQLPRPSGPQSQRAPRFAPVGTHASPMASILLDPRHQPASTLAGPRPLQKSVPSNRRSTIVSPRRRVHDLIEHDENEDGPSSQSNPPSNHTDLGESWLMKADNAEDSQDATVVKDDGPGTLGLVYQIVKGQTADRGTGAQM
jgi:autophagy-related protein 9